MLEHVEPDLLAPRAVRPAPTPRPGARPSRAEAEAAVRTLLRYVGDDPAREGLLETPARVVRAYDEFFAGYREDPRQHLLRTFEEVEGYEELVLVRDIEVLSHCEHHMVAFTGRAHVAYLPSGRVVGLSKLARVVEGYARRLQVQEKLTVQVARAVDEVLRPRGVAVLVEARHECMGSRGVHKPGARTVTTHFTGELRDEARRREFLSLVGMDPAS